MSEQKAINDIIVSSKGFIISSDSSRIDFWNLDLTKLQSTLFLDKQPIMLHSMQIKNIIKADKKLFLSTYAGDIVKINFKKNQGADFKQKPIKMKSLMPNKKK